MPTKTGNPFIDKANQELEVSETPEERAERVSQSRRQNIARQRELGRMGPQFGQLGGRPRKRRAAEVVSEDVKAMAADMSAAIRDGLGQDIPAKTRLEAVKLGIQIERDEDKLRMEEEESDLKHASREELLDYLREKLSSGGPAAEVMEEAFTTISGTAQEIAEEDETREG